MPLQHNQIYKIRNVGRDTFLSHIPPNGDGDTSTPTLSPLACSIMLTSYYSLSVVGQAGQGEPNQEVGDDTSSASTPR